MTARRPLAWIAAAARWLVRWFEDGDLVPLLVIVSAAHYIAILSAVDPWFVALPLGVLVDLGHYRAVNIAARYSRSDWRQYAVRWFVAAGLTVISGAYHLRYYGGDWALALPIPALIVALAYFRRMDARPAVKPAPPAPARVTKPAELRESAEETEPHPAPGNGHKRYDCPLCGRTCESQPQYAAHLRQCRARAAVSAGKETP